MTSRRKIGVLLAPFIGLMLIASACGDDGGTAEPDGPTTTKGVTAATTPVDDGYCRGRNRRRL